MLPSTPEAHEIINALENLLAKYIIFPARASLLRSKRTRAELGEEANSSLYKDLLAPLSKSAANESKDSSPSTALFSIAIRCTPRETAKQRTAENPWLQSLFRHLFENAVLVSSSSPNLDESSKRTLGGLLNEAIDHNVLLDTAILEMLLSNFSGIFSDDDGLDIVDWDLISWCIELTPDVFVLRSLDRTSNILLTSLLTSITERFFELPSGSSDKYENVLSGIILPLVQAFAHARDLPRFIYHWTAELVRFEKIMDKVDAELSIWEDSRLSQTVADLINSALTTGQVKEILITAQNSLPSLVATGPTRPLSSLVILDCAINGCKSDSCIVELTDTARSIYASLLDFASNDKYWQIEKRWRVWRILSTINFRWSRMHAAPGGNSAEQLVMRRALDLITCKILKANYTEELHCFNYIVSFAVVEKHGSEILQQPPDHTVKRAFDTVLSHQQISSKFLSSEEWVASCHSGLAPKWNSRSDEVASVEILMMICQAQLLSSPEVLQ